MEQSINPKSEQHMLASTEQYSALLHSLPLSTRVVLEFGVGTGVLTKLILAQQPLKVIGYELDATLLGDLRHPDLALEQRDINTLHYDNLTPQHCVISNPPYSCLEYIKRNIIERHNIQDCVLMVPEKKLYLFADFQIAFVLQENDFVPPAKGLHYVLRRGFA